MVTMTQAEGTYEPLLISIYGGIQVYIVLFSNDTAATTKFLKKNTKASKAAEKDKYFVHRIDAVNLVFAGHPPIIIK